MLADLTPTELLDAAKQNSESVNAELVVKSSAELADYLTELAHQDQAKRLLLPGVDASEWADYQLDGWAQNPGSSTSPPGPPPLTGIKTNKTPTRPTSPSG